MKSKMEIIRIDCPYFMPTPRPRSFIENGKIKTSNPAKYNFYKKEVTRKIKSKLDPFYEKKNGDVTVYLNFYLTNKRKRDLDNLAKGVLDCMNGIIYNDDNQITNLVIKKTYLKNELETLIIGVS